jgi:hypothetical protein
MLGHLIGDISKNSVRTHAIYGIFLITTLGIGQDAWAQNDRPSLLLHDQRCGLYNPVSRSTRDAKILAVASATQCGSSGLYQGAIVYGVTSTSLHSVDASLRERVGSVIRVGMMESGQLVLPYINIAWESGDTAVLVWKGDFQGFELSNVNKLHAAIDDQMRSLGLVNSEAHKNFLKTVVNEWSKNPQTFRQEFIFDTGNPIVASPFLSDNLKRSAVVPSGSPDRGLYDEPKSLGRGMRGS